MSKTPRSQRILPRQVVTTRDRVDLCTDVYLTPFEEAVPVVVMRTPYGRNLPLLMQMALRFNQEGMAVVLQDCRGRYQSGGSYDWQREEDDTWDTLAWIAEQPWSSGRVGLYGMSITAHPNFLVAASGPPNGIDVAAMVSVMGTVSHYHTFYRNGVLFLHWALPWFTMMDEQERGRTVWQDLPWDEKYRQLPLVSMASGSGARAAVWEQMLASPHYAAMWRELDSNHRIGGLAVPTLFLSGWSDFMLGQAIEGYRLASQSADVQHRLVLGPWDHKTLFKSFGAARRGESSEVDLLEEIVEWFSRWLAAPEAREETVVATETREQKVIAPVNGNVANGIGANGKPVPPEVQLYVETGGGWIGGPDFPLPETETRSFYLRSGGRANTRDGDGWLSEEPGSLSRDTFTYDPDDPVPTRGGAIWPFPAAELEAGPCDQSEVEERSDVLVYVTEPLDEDLFVVGPLEAELWVSTSAQDTDFTAKLVDVDPFGVSTIVQDGIVRGRFHRSLEQPEYLEPHRPYQMRIAMQSTSRRFRRGHRVGLEISSSCFPKFDRNLNTAGDWQTAAVGLIAQQTVFHGGPMTSRLLLPVVDAATIEARRTAASASATNVPEVTATTATAIAAGTVS